MTGHQGNLLLAAVVLMAAPAAGRTETLLSVDASASVAAPETGYLRVGANVSPSGAVIGVNSRYLTRDGKPWLPVMGEFHYSRFPPQYWDEQLAKMKAAGVDIVSFYVIWNHHEETAGRFNWSGDRDLRRFVELCARHGLYVWPRLGPWSHAEVRFGGIPDWVVNSVPTRTDDPVYLGYVGAFYDQIGAQLKGLLWKDGGPVIGIQLENEYNLTGPGQGRDHIATLKRLALKAGFDVPLYTVTGWDNTVYPAREVTPVLGGYPDKPWDVSARELPPSETYAFRFGSRVTGDLGAQTSSSTPGDAEGDSDHTPFLTAEFGAGMGPMYRRRTFTSAVDGAALLPVQLGSGVNMFGYYMFQGGRNPEGRTSLEENTAIGGYNDLPLINYDLNAPLGQYGQAHVSLALLRPYHLFLESFGDRLAPMTVRRPDVVPSRLDDLSTPRWSLRSLGDSGFLFFNNHIRHYSMTPENGIRFQVKLPSGPLTFPSRPLDVPADSSFIWPINFDMDGVRLAWATAQPITRIEGEAGPLYVFEAIDSVPVEMVFDAAPGLTIQARSGHEARADGGRRLIRDIRPGLDAAVRLRRAGQPDVTVMVVSSADASRLWRAPFAGRDRLILTDAELMANDDGLELRSEGYPYFRFALFPAPARVAGDLKVSPARREGLFAAFDADAAPRHPTVELDLLRRARPVPPIVIGGPAKAAVEPVPETFGRAAAWTLTLAPGALNGLSDAYLEIRYRGDVARLFSGPRMIDDQFYSGAPWEIGLKRFKAEIGAPLTLEVLPLRRDAPVYLQPEAALPESAGDQVADIDSVRVIPEYALRLTP